MKSFARCLLPVVLGFSAAAQSAEPIQIAFDQTLGVNLWTSGTSQYLTGAMQYFLQGGDSFEAFCVEIGQDPSFGGFQPYTVAQFSGSTGQMLQGLFSSSYAGVSSAMERAAFQVAVWEITHETSGSFNVSYEAGSFYFKDFTAPATEAELLAFESLANGYLNAASAYQGQALYKINWLQNGTYQDLVTAAPVPEPSSYALMLGGLALVAIAKRRRRN